MEPTFSRITSSAVETRSSADYCHDNRKRPGPPQLVIQRTLAGAAFFSNPGGTRLVSRGQAMLFSHREASRYGYPPDAGKPYRLWYITFTATDALRGLWRRIVRDHGPVISFPEVSRSAELFEELANHFQQRTFVDRWQETDLLFQLLIALYRQQVEHNHRSHPIELARDLIHDRFRSPINLKDIAARAGVTREHLCREYRRRFGETPAAALRTLRLEHARTLLLSTSSRVEDVSLSCGFATLSAFGRAFVRRFGMAPSVMREQAQRGR